MKSSDEISALSLALAEVIKYENCAKDGPVFGAVIFITHFFG